MRSIHSSHTIRALLNPLLYRNLGTVQTIHFLQIFLISCSQYFLQLLLHSHLPSSALASEPIFQFYFILFWPVELAFCFLPKN